MKRKHWWGIATLLYILFIYGNSMKTATVSSGQSGFVLEHTLGFFSSLGLSDIGITEHIIRKAAHFSEYTVLGILLVQSIRMWCQRPAEQVLYTFLLGFFVPFVDETIQLFVEGRSGQISDVWLDIAGVAFGTVLICCLKRLYSVRRRKRRRKAFEKKY